MVGRQQVRSVPSLRPGLRTQTPMMLFAVAFFRTALAQRALVAWVRRAFLVLTMIVAATGLLTICTLPIKR